MYRRNGPEKRDEPAIGRLARAIERHAPRPGDYQTEFPPLSLHRRHAPTDPIPCTYPLGLILTAQGDKRVLVADKVLDYTPGQSMLATIDMPVISHVTRATTREPYLGLLLRLEPRAILAAASDLRLPPPDRKRARQQVSVERLDLALLDALQRLVELLDDPVLLPRLAPLIQEEIVVRLLTGPHAAHLQSAVKEEAPNRQIAHAVTAMKADFVKAVRVGELAANANMSVSSFRQHFRSLTGMSPLQYQKQLRLQEARQLMLTQDVDASRAAGLVGYESVSQFSREYRSRFGAPPHRDVRRMRANGTPRSAV